MTDLWLLLAYDGSGSGFIFESHPALTAGGNPIIASVHTEDTELFVPDGLDAGIYKVTGIKLSDNGEDPPEISGDWRRMTLV